MLLNSIPRSLWFAKWCGRSVLFLGLTGPKRSPAPGTARGDLPAFGHLTPARGLLLAALRFLDDRQLEYRRVFFNLLVVILAVTLVGWALRPAGYGGSLLAPLSLALDLSGDNIAGAFVRPP